MGEPLAKAEWSYPKSVGGTRRGRGGVITSPKPGVLTDPRAQ